jgi:hypothetical protein
MLAWSSFCLSIPVPITLISFALFLPLSFVGYHHSYHLLIENLGSKAQTRDNEVALQTQKLRLLLL